MKGLGLRLLLTASTAVFLGLLDVNEADAHTCSSTCSQILRACNHAAKGARKASLAQCDLDRDTCRADCDADPNCPGDSICNDGRILCREAANTARGQARHACRAVRDLCPPETCVDPIDGDCVRTCKFDEKDCGRDAKQLSTTCKRGCPSGNGRRGCVRTCKKQRNQALELCSDQEALCLGECIGIIPPP